MKPNISKFFENLPPLEVLLEMAMEGFLIEHKDEKGHRHSESEPAVMLMNGKKLWFWHGQYVDVKNQEDFNRWLKLRSFE